MMKRKVEEALHYEDDHKKFRTENPIPSQVIHLRNLPDEITETEVANLSISFGHIVYMVVTRKNGQALIEMENQDVAEAMFEFYQEHPPHLRNKRCFIQFSVHSTLQYPDSSMHPEAEMAVHHSNQMCDSMAREDAGPVLRIIIEDWDREKISNLHFYKIFYHYGTLEKIVVYVNKGLFQGFVEYTSELSAKVAKSLLNGVCVFPRSCTMKVTFSNRKTVEIGREDEMARDYAKHPVSAYEFKSVQVTTGYRPRHEESHRRSRDPMDTLAALQPLLSQAVNHPDDAMPLLRSLAPAIRGLLNGRNDYRDSRDNYDREFHHDNSKYGERMSPLLIVSNLNETKVNADALFKIFGCYGDITRVKIMYNRKNTALIQFVSGEHAQRALQYLNGVNLYGKPIHANFSKHDRISHRAPAPNSEDEPGGDDLHKDYTDSNLLRFRKASSRNHVNIFEPTRVLHIAGLVDEVTEEDVEAIFQDHKFRPRKIKIITPNNKKMALVEMGSVESAVEALITLHDFDLCGLHLRVSFSKKDV